MALTKSQQASQMLLQFDSAFERVPIGVYSDIADVLDCSRQLVDQRREALGMQKIREQHDFTHPCKMCGEAIPNRRAAVYCNGECRCDYTKTMKGGWIMCEMCGETRHIYFSELSYANPLFCSKECQGGNAGKQYGFGSQSASEVLKDS